LSDIIWLSCGALFGVTCLSLPLVILINVVALQYADYECICPEPFTGKRCNRVCRRSVFDLAFVVDISNEIDESSEMLQLLQLLAYGLPIATDRVRVAMVVYSTNVVIRFDLNAYSAKSQVGLS